MVLILSLHTLLYPTPTADVATSEERHNSSLTRRAEHCKGTPHHLMRIPGHRVGPKGNKSRWREWHPWQAQTTPCKGSGCLALFLRLQHDVNYKTRGDPFENLQPFLCLQREQGKAGISLQLHGGLRALSDWGQPVQGPSFGHHSRAPGVPHVPSVFPLSWPNCSGLGLRAWLIPLLNFVLFPVQFLLLSTQLMTKCFKCVFFYKASSYPASISSLIQRYPLDWQGR